MKQIQLSIPDKLDSKLHERVKELKQSEEQAITTLLEEALTTPTHCKNAGEALSSLSQLGIKGPKDLSQTIDAYLYEEDE